MEVIFDILFTFFFEIFIQLFGELLIEMGIRAIFDPPSATTERREKQSPWLAGLGYILLGLMVGAISVKVLPQGVFHSRELRFANLLVTPLVAGLVMALIGRWRRRHEQPTIGLESFFYGYLFALSMASMRYFFTH